MKNGRRESCTHLVDAFQGRLLHEAEHVFSVSAEDAEELVSDVLTTVVARIHTFEFKRYDSDFTGWMIRIFQNRVRDYVRQQAATGAVFVEFVDDPLPDEDAHNFQEKELADFIVRQYEEANREGDGTSDGEISSRLLAIADALERLESWERVLLRCRALEIPYEEIAEYTRKPVAQLKVYHARVKKKLVKILAEYYPELEHHEE